jgi:hypothetical protein
MEITLSRAMLANIDRHLDHARHASKVIDVYRTAEHIRLEHINENVAREDIINQLVRRAGSNTIMEFTESLGTLEIVEDSDLELLMPIDNLHSVH